LNGSRLRLQLVGRWKGTLLVEYLRS